MKIYLVGGAVRDRLLKLPIHERDYVVVGATPEAMTKQGFKPVGRDFPVFLHPKTFEEYALARTERKIARGHQGFSFYTDPNVTLIDDLMRRDLTINAMAEDEHGQLTDPFHGQDDLKARVLRHVSQAFTEDPLRILRLARFQAYLGQFNFSIAPETLSLMKAMVQDKVLAELSDERIWKELVRALETDYPELFFETLSEIGALTDIFSTPHPRHRTQGARGQPLLLFAIISYRAKYLRVAPKEYEDLAHLVHEKADIGLHFAGFSAIEKVQFLRSLDFLRRKERFDLFLKACGIIHANFPLVEIENAANTLRHLDRQAISASANNASDIPAKIFDAECQALKV